MYLNLSKGTIITMIYFCNVILFVIKAKVFQETNFRKGLHSKSTNFSAQMDMLKMFIVICVCLNWQI